MYKAVLRVTGKGRLLEYAKPNKTLNACILYIAALSGVGYSSGQEIRIFFVRYGRFGLVTLSAVPIILFRYP